MGQTGGGRHSWAYLELFEEFCDVTLNEVERNVAQVHLEGWHIRYWCRRKPQAKV